MSSVRTNIINKIDDILSAHPTLEQVDDIPESPLYDHLSMILGYLKKNIDVLNARSIITMMTCAQNMDPHRDNYYLYEYIKIIVEGGIKFFLIAPNVTLIRLFAYGTFSFVI